MGPCGAGVTQGGPRHADPALLVGPLSSTSSQSAGPTQAILSFGRSLCLVQDQCLFSSTLLSETRLPIGLLPAPSGCPRPGPSSLLD